MATERLLTTREVGKRTGFSLQKVRALIDAGKLPAINTSPGTKPRWMVRECDLDAFLTPSGLEAPK